MATARAHLFESPDADQSKDHSVFKQSKLPLKTIRSAKLNLYKDCGTDPLILQRKPMNRRRWLERLRPPSVSGLSLPEILITQHP